MTVPDAPRLPSKIVFVVRIAFVLAFLASLVLIGLGIAAQTASFSQSFLHWLRDTGLDPGFKGQVANRVADASRAAQSGPQFGLDLAFSAVNLALAGFLYWLRPRDVAGPLLAFALVGTAAVCNLGAHTVYEAVPAATWEAFSHDAFTIVTAVLYAFAVVVFPDGLLVPLWSRGKRIALYVLLAAAFSALALMQHQSRAVVLVTLFGLGVPFAGLAAQAYRYRHPATAVHRQLSRLLVIALLAALLIGVFAVARGVQNANAPVFEGRGFQSVPLALYRVFQLAMTIVPLALFAGIFRYRLFSVDTLVTRTLVYGALAGFVTAVYITVVVGVGGLLGAGTNGNIPLSIIATFFVAVAFEPAKGRMERLANRIVYGHRATPYEVLSEFSERVADAVASEELLSRMARVLGEGTGAVRADVWLAVDDELRPMATWPETGGAALEPLKIVGPEIPWIHNVANAVAVRHQGELYGALSVAKSNNEALTPTEDKLMADLGRQAGLVLRNMRLTAELRARLEELRASRQRIVAAGDEERRRLERNLHDGAQQELVALKVKLSMAEDMADELEGDTEPLLDLLGQLKDQTGDAVESLRDLARGIYPPLLAAEGLRVALNAQARKSTLDIEVDAEVNRYPQDLEAAIYFCCLEAFQNAAKYAGDCHVTATLREEDGGLRLDIADTGCGFAEDDVTAGMGTRNMADRLESLDGWLKVSSTPGQGTTVSGWVPLLHHD